MHEDVSDDAPTTEEVMQRDGGESVPLPTLPVEVQGPVRVQVMPRRGKQTFSTFAVKAGVPIPLISMVPTRAQATIIATTDDLWLGPNRGAVDTTGGVVPSAAVLWPPSLPFVTESSAELWACSTADQSISILTESWED